MKIVYPRCMIKPENIGEGAFMLVGPMGGGNRWQKSGICLLDMKINAGLAEKRDFTIASPLAIQDPRFAPFLAADPTAEQFERTRQWEQYWIDRAALQSPLNPLGGCVVVWLPEEDRDNPRKGGGSYAQDSRREIGWLAGQMRLLRMMSEYNPSSDASQYRIRIALGASPQFPGISTIHDMFVEASGSKGFPIYPTLEETVDAAINIAGIPRSSSTCLSGGGCSE